jgi:hypothetical protein
MAAQFFSSRTVVGRVLLLLHVREQIGVIVLSANVNYDRAARA